MRCEIKAAESFQNIQTLSFYKLKFILDIVMLWKYSSVTQYMLDLLKAIFIFVRMNCLASRGPHTFLIMEMPFTRGTEKKKEEIAFLVQCYM